MKCSKCGKELANDEKVCTECGTEVGSETGTEQRKFIPKTDFDFKALLLSCLTFILSVILKPISSLKEKLKDYSDVKNAGILVILISFGRMIINLLGSMISTIFAKEVNFWSGESKVVVSFDRLKNLDYFDLIIKQLFGFIIVVAAIAGIYYIVSIVMKKTVDYFKLVTITAVSFIPFFIVSSLVCVIVSYIYTPISLFIGVASFVYSLLTFVIAMDNEIDFKDSNFKVYFHTICLTGIFIVSYYVLSNSFSSIGSILNFLS